MLKRPRVQVHYPYLESGLSKGMLHQDLVIVTQLIKNGSFIMVDIAAPYGRKIKAPLDGKVILAKPTMVMESR